MEWIGYIFFGLWFIAIMFILCSITNTMNKMNTGVGDLNKKLASLPNDKDTPKTGTILLPVTKMDIKAECNTVLPLPIGAEMCNHNMDVVTNQVIRAPHEERCVIILQCTKCGAMDKTIAMTSPPPKPLPPPPPPPLPKSECRHEWMKEKSVTLQSAFEQMEDLLINQQKNGKNYIPKTKKTENDEETLVFDPMTAPAWMFQKRFVRERVCTKCGEIDKIITSNFDTFRGEDEESSEEKPNE